MISESESESDARARASDGPSLEVRPQTRRNLKPRPPQTPSRKPQAEPDSELWPSSSRRHSGWAGAAATVTVTVCVTGKLRRAGHTQWPRHWNIIIESRHPVAHTVADLNLS
jgi:hypothetical protein